MGCSKNLVDSEKLMTLFEQAGYHCTHDAKRIEGEIVVINTCGFIEDAKQESIDTLDAEDGTSKGFWLPLGQESVGTQRFFSRIGMWLAALESGSVLVVDEIESSMHPLLTRHLIEMVQDAAINMNHTQLIFTTHDTGLLDLTLLRRDQIWFAEKDEKTMQTDVYALTEFSPRKGENISKGYLQGRYAKNSSSRI